ncbi:MAG TPA: glycosyltransferase family 39 protein [Gaiellaceae bacterium]|nr:glycosyltransferase family 39 protein [Gaiellaceae bacterium]
MVGIAERAQHAGVRGVAFSRWRVLVLLSGCAGIALHVWVYRSAIGVPVSDDGVVGLMALHALHGHFTTFFWGQAYGGSQEALLTVPVFWIFGPSWLALYIVPMALTACTSVVLWLVGRRLFGESAGILAGALFWVWPPFAVYELTHQRGFYAADVLYTALLLLLALRVVERPDRLRVGLLGLVLGLAYWQSSQIVPVAVPIVAWTIWKQPRCLRHLWVAVPLAALGALPWILYNVHHDWASITSLSQGQSSYAHRLRVFVSPLLPMALGLRATWTQERLLPALLTYLLLAALLAAFVYGGLRAMRTEASLLYLVLVAFPFIYAISAWTYTESEPRYLMALMPVLALLVAQLARSFPVAVLLLGCAVAVSVVNLQRMNTYELRPETYPPANRSMAGLVSTLDRLRVDRVYAGYEIAYRLDFDTHERIVAVMNESPLRLAHGQVTPEPTPGSIRWPAYDRLVRGALHAFVFYRQAVPTSTVVPVLRRDGYRSYPAGPYVVYVPAGVSPA